MSKNTNSSDNKWIGLLSTLLAISIALNIIIYAKGSSIFPHKKEMAATNVTLKKQVEKYKSEINRYAGISPNIDKVVADAKMKIEAKEKQILSLKREKWAKEKENRELGSQLDSLQEKYLNVIDSILVERERVKLVNQKIEGLESVISGLNAKIGYASILVGDNLKTTAYKKGNNDKKQATAMARKTSEFEVCIDILENRLSKTGPRKLYIVITSSNAEVIYDKALDAAPEFYNPDFKTNALCSKIVNYDYKNKKLNICTSINPKTPLLTGLYVLEVFSDDQKLGMTTFSLR